MIEPSFPGSAPSDTHVASYCGLLHAAVDDEIMTLGLASDGCIDCFEQDFIIGACAQWRAQIGGVFGPSLAATPRDYLFYSGGGGTVRGQPYESLGVDVLEGGTLRTGGTRFLGVSGELRAGITDAIGIVAFYDAGFISADAYFSGGEWQSGAGLGLRYNTPIGPIRLDVAAPVSGSTGDGAQIYLGIGQAF